MHADQSRGGGDERRASGEGRRLRIAEAEADLQDWHWRTLSEREAEAARLALEQERRNAEQQRRAAEQDRWNAEQERREAEAARLALEQALREEVRRQLELEGELRLERSHPDRLLGAATRRVGDRFLPPRTLRRRLSRLTFRAALILAMDGPAALARRGGGYLRRKAGRAWTSGAARLRPRPTGLPLTADPEPLVPALTADPEPAALLALPGPDTVIAEAIALPGPTADRVPAPRIRPVARRGSVAVLSSSLGNYYFNEIRDLIATGMSELGLEVRIGTERRGLREDVDWNVVVAPHEFFLLGDGQDLREADWPDNVILVSTEQPSTTWFATSWDCLRRARMAWDIDYNTSRLLRDHGIPSDYLPLGYAPRHAPFGRVEELPMHYGTCHLPEEVRRSPAAGGPLSERPLDVFFVGSHTCRRESFFGRVAPVLTDYHSCLYIVDNRAPQLPGKTTYLDSPTVNGLSQRSKVLLNIHHGKDVYFEWHRVVLQGLWHRTLVISEPCSVAPPFRAGIDFVEAGLDQMPRVLRYYLDDPRGRREAQEIADSGHRTLVSECRLSRFLEALLDGQDSPGAVRAHFDAQGWGDRLDRAVCA